jgi:hypothetical protein
MKQASESDSTAHTVEATGVRYLRPGVPRGARRLIVLVHADKWEPRGYLG